MTHRLSGSKVACGVIAVLIPVFLHAQQDAGSSVKKPYVSTGYEAALSGSITFTGEPLRQKLIDMSADLSCLEGNPNPTYEDVIINDGKLVNVLVFVKSSLLDSYAFELPTTPATLKHKRCRYVPRVMGVRAGQQLQILNSDRTYHNTHPTPKFNVEWNQTQPEGTPPLVKTFARPETAIPFKDNQHPWEIAYVSVFSHPFFAVSDKFGNYEIKGLPPGQYTVVAWHERFGEKTFDVTLVPGDVRDISFTFDIKDCVGYVCPK